MKSVSCSRMKMSEMTNGRIAMTSAMATTSAIGPVSAGVSRPTVSPSALRLTFKAIGGRTGR